MAEREESIKDRKSIKDTQKELSNKLEQMSSEDERDFYVCSLARKSELHHGGDPY